MAKTTPRVSFSLGVIQKITASLFYGSMGLWSVLMAGEFGPFSQAWVRALIVIIILSLYIAQSRLLKLPRPSDWKWFIIIGLASLNVVPYFLGFQALGASLGTVIFIIVMTISGYFIGRLLFKEKITFIKVLSLLIALTGVLVIYGFSLDGQTIFGLAMMLLAGILAALVGLVPKKLIGQYHQSQIMLTAFLFIFIFTLPLAWINGEILPAITLDIHWLALVIYALIGIAAMFLNITSLKHLTATTASLLSLAEIIFGVLFGVIFLRENFNLTMALGIIIIIFGLALTTLTQLFKLKKPKISHL